MPHGLVEVNRSGLIAVAQTAQAIAEPAHIHLGQAAPPAGQENKTEEVGRRLGRHDHRFTGMERQASPGEMQGDAGAPLGEDCRVVVKEGEVVDISQIGRAQHLLGEMVDSRRRLSLRGAPRRSNLDEIASLRSR